MVDDADIELAANELSSEIGVDQFKLKQELEQLLNYRVPLEEAKESVRDNYGTGRINPSYPSFDVWDEQTPPPGIASEDWVAFDSDAGRRELRKAGRKLQRGYQYVTYVLSVSLRAGSLQELEQQARLMFDESPAWVRKAYNADHPLYVGHSSNLSNRLQTHGAGTLSDSPPPSRLTVLADVEGVGAVSHIDDAETAESIEKSYAVDLRDVSDSAFVYQN